MFIKQLTDAAFITSVHAGIVANVVDGRVSHTTKIRTLVAVADPCITIENERFNFLANIELPFMVLFVVPWAMPRIIEVDEPVEESGERLLFSS